MTELSIHYGSRTTSR